MKTKKIILCIVVLSIFFMLSQSVNATEIIKNEVSNKKIKDVEKNIENLNVINSRLEKIIIATSNDSMKSLHDIVMLVWEIISLFIGHNLVSLSITRLLCCWFVFPIVFLNNIGNFSISGGGLFSIMKRYLDEIKPQIDDLIFIFGALSLLVLPIIYTWVFLIALSSVIAEGFHVEGGMMEGIRNDLSMIYNPYYRTESFQPYTQNISKLKFGEYVRVLNIDGYLYHTGLLGVLISPIILSLLHICFNDYNKKYEKLDGVNERPFLDFILDLIYMFLNFITHLIDRMPVIE